MIEIILWIIGVSVFTLLGSFYIRKYQKPDLIIGLYVSFVLISNIVAYKIVEFNLGFYTFYATAATLIFAVTFLMTDIVNEHFGRKETQKMIFIAFIAQLAAAFFIYLSIILKPAPFFLEQELFAKILGFTPRIMVAGWIAFFVSENIDAYIFAWFKKYTEKHLWMRNAFSSIPSMAVDTLIFVTIAFYGIQPLMPLYIGLIAIKWLVCIIDIPFMYLNNFIIHLRFKKHDEKKNKNKKNRSNFLRKKSKSR